MCTVGGSSTTRALPWLFPYNYFKGSSKFNMADYWKSQPRKFCEFCKCWIADNKPSVDFHEKGKRHKENVQKKIDELRKRSGEKAKEQEEMNEYFAQMERDAVAALKKDLARDPSLAAQYGVKLKTSDSSEKEKKKAVKSKSPEPESATTGKVREWYEAKSPEGYSYYWNITTNESVWEPPEDFVSLAEQEGQEEETGDNTAQASESAEAEPAEREEAPVEEPPRKVFRVDPVGTRGAAYGAWETVRQHPAPDPDPEPEPEPEPEPVSEPPVDPPALEDIPLPGEIPLPDDIPLPSDIPLPDSHPDTVPQSLPEPVKKERFKEKTVSSLGPSTGASVGFKKRKVAASARNARQREDND
ncbi:uncharacterized protein LOC143298983 isoform X2 [Babylonia areolata]|uniref:uncharacterized protein LOC143298983 isoform X2 n=1 Tax=Babylonia areolata TaxID=304850 RepID=UPI003FD651BE